MHSRMIMRENEIFYKSKLSLTPKRKVSSCVGRLCEEGSLSVGLSLCALWSMWRKGQSKSVRTQTHKKKSEFEFECEDILLLHTQTRTHSGPLWPKDKNYFSKFFIIAKRIFDISSACE